MKKLSKQKRAHLLLTAAVTLVVLALLGWFLLRPQYQRLHHMARNGQVTQAKLQHVETTIKSIKTVEAKLHATAATLDRAESDMASGDSYSWTYNLLRRFKQPYAVDIPEIGQPSRGPEDLLPGFPFQQIRVTISGSAYYHDLGRFIADFENTFPHIRIVNLTLTPADPSGVSQKLSFRMDIVALVKPNPS